MKFLKSKAKSSFAAVQTVPGVKNQHPYRELYSYGSMRKNELKLYSVLREAVPIIDAAISKTVRLVGGFRVECENKDEEYELNKFLDNIQVNACERGIESFIATFLDQLLTYGTAVGEIVPNIVGDDILALYNASLHHVELKTGNNPLDLQVCKREGNKVIPVKYQDLLVFSALKPEPGEVSGTSILKGLPFVSSILMSIYNSIGANWERVGNIRFSVNYKPGNDSSEKAYARERAATIASEWQKAMHNTSSISDFVSIGDVNVKVIGADNQVLDSEIPVKQMLEQIVAKLSIPPFLLGLSWSTTERMSTQQADILTSELEFYRRLLNPVILKICYMWQRLNGYTGDLEVNWGNINLQDEVEIANARLMLARAAEIEKRLEM